MAAAIATLLVISGCTQTTSTQAPSSPVVAQPVLLPTPGLTERQRLRRSLELLEEGDEPKARVELVEYVSKVPRSRTGRSLLRQIDTTPDVYFPAEYREVVLETGQSLSTIAKTYLGSAVEFHALAKYNEIRRPRRVVPGQVIKVPLTDTAVEVFAASMTEGAGTTASGDEAGPDDDVVPAMDVGDADIVSSDAPMLTEPEVEAAEGGAIDAVEGIASEVVDESDIVSEPGLPATDASVMEPVLADTADEMSAEEATADTLSPGTDVENALTELEAEAPEDLVADVDLDDLHRQAITAYRSQDLDTAIALWDRVLEADPDYDSARLYRNQAKALKERLKNLN